VVPGSGKITLTGRMGEVMRESARTAVTYVRARASALGLAADFADRTDVHLHMPEGAIPKDGPSAGVCIAISVISALLRIPVRRDVAMTGEITLRGRVLPIGGLKEKLLAAHRAGLTTVIIPKENRKDLREIPRRVLKLLRLVLVDHVDEVLREALLLDDPDVVFGPPRTVIEFRKGELVVREGGHEMPEDDGGARAPQPGDEVREQPGR
jgi:ATP-dependent Lon protease